MPDEESDIVQAFESGAVRGGFGPARRIDTHLSHVFLATDRAVKIKRRVKLPFADFTTLEARHRTLMAELDINRRTAPRLYLDVMPISHVAAGWALGGTEPAQDWALIMRRFEDGALFDEMAGSGKLTIELIEATAKRIAAFHRSLAPSEHPADAEYYLAIIDELVQTEADGARRLGINRSSQALFSALGRSLEMARALIEARAARGHVRRGHGDLHLRNICLFDGEPTLFDALEFDEGLATNDTLYDFAFLLMDLTHRGLAAHANVALNRYWDASGEDEEALGGLAFFMALRAAVRMAVSVEMGALREADQYLALGMDLLRPVRPRLVALGGLSGTGKSAVARALAHELDGVCGARLLRTDVVRKQLAGVGAEARLPNSSYAPQQRLDVYRVLAERAAAALSSTSVVADATFREAEARAAIAHAKGAAPFIGLWLSAPQSVRLARVRAREGDASDATVEIAAAQTEPDQLDDNWRRLNAADDLGKVLARARDSLGLKAP